MSKELVYKGKIKIFLFVLGSAFLVMSVVAFKLKQMSDEGGLLFLFLLAIGLLILLFATNLAYFRIIVYPQDDKIVFRSLFSQTKYRISEIKEYEYARNKGNCYLVIPFYSTTDFEDIRFSIQKKAFRFDSRYIRNLYSLNETLAVLVSSKEG